MNEKTLLLASSIVFVVLIVLSFLVSSNFALSTNILVIGIVILILPYYLFKFFEYKKIKTYESHFPNFLRDLAESQRAGMTIVQAIQETSKSDYGLLSREIKKINNQLSWNIPLEKVLNNFSKRMKKSRVIARSIMVIDQANKSGGNIEDTMDSLAGNIEMIRDVQEEKGTLLNQQVIMMYTIFFIFLGISIALIKFLIPMLQAQTQTQTSAFGLTQFQANPCMQCSGNEEFACVGCKIFNGVAAAFGFGSEEDPAAYYRALFFTMVLVQGFFSGLIAGQIGSDSVIAGIKHSMIMVLTGFFTFIIVVKIGII